LAKKQKDLYCYIYNDTTTTAIMDKYDGVGKHNTTIYDRLILRNNSFRINLGDYSCECLLIIKRITPRTHKTGDITFTDFKSEHGATVINYAKKCIIQKYIKFPDIIKKNEIYFDIPYYLRAQNSLNKLVIGWEWYWDVDSLNCMEGTEYGETNMYGFVGVIFSNKYKFAK